MSKELKRKKKKEELKKEFRERPPVEMGEYQRIKDHGKHYIHDHPLMSIKGKKFKRVVEGGDILICPPYLVKHFMDAYVRIDAAAQTQEEIETQEDEAGKPKIEEVAGGYNVLSALGVKLNSGVLTKEEAEELLQQVQPDKEEDENE